MENLFLLASVLLLGLHGLALVWLWQIRKMNIRVERHEQVIQHHGLTGPDSDTATPETPREALNWFVSDAEQAAQERELMKQSAQRAAHDYRGHR